MPMIMLMMRTMMMIDEFFFFFFWVSGWGNLVALNLCSCFPLFLPFFPLAIHSSSYSCTFLLSPPSFIIALTVRSQQHARQMEPEQLQALLVQQAAGEPALALLELEQRPHEHVQVLLAAMAAGQPVERLLVARALLRALTDAVVRAARKQARKKKRKGRGGRKEREEKMKKKKKKKKKRKGGGGEEEQEEQQ